MIGQYMNVLMTKDWTFMAFGGRWGICEAKVTPPDMLKTEIWMYGRVFESWTPMSTVLIVLGLIVVAALICGRWGYRWLKKRLRVDGAGE